MERVQIGTLGVYKQCGSTSIFFVGFILPLLLLAFVLSLDLGRYFEALERLQQVADGAALQSIRGAPHNAAVENIANTYIAQNTNGANIRTQVSAQHDSVLVDVSGTITPLLTQFFDPNLTLPIRAGAAARVNPLNVMLAMDNSSYMSPSYVVGAQYWGNLGQHPASVLFQNSAGPGKILIDPNLHSYSNIDATLTQQCFSPPQLALKQATLGIYQYLVGISLNSVGLMFYPGRTPDPASTTPTLTRDPFIARSVNSTDTIQSNGEAAFEDYTSAAPRHSRDVHCAAIASHSPSASSPYTLPLPRTGLHRATLNQQGNFPINFVSQDQYFYWHYNKNYAQYLTAREVIWSRASQGMTGVLELTSRFTRVLEAASLYLQAAPAVSARGGLATGFRTALIVMAGDVPRHDGNQRFPISHSGTSAIEHALDQQFANLDLLGIHVYYLLFKHTGNDYDNFVGRKDALLSYADTVQNFSVIYAADAADAVRLATERIALVERRYVLSQ